MKYHVKRSIKQRTETIVYEDGSKEEIVMETYRSLERCSCEIGKDHNQSYGVLAGRIE